MINRTRSPRLKLHIAEVSFKQLVNNAIRQLRGLDGSHRLEVKLTIEGCLPFYSDSEQLQIIFNSIISNAIKYRHPHELHPCLNLHIEVDETGAKMSFHDNGIGISREHLSKIFDMFYRVPGIRAEGSGLGLFMVREIAKKMKGKAKAESGTCDGTRFIVELPNRIDPDHLRKLNKLIQNG